MFLTFRLDRPVVEKHFPSPEDWVREKRMYRALSDALPVPAVLEAAPGLLVLEYLPLPTLLKELERQEAVGFDPHPWEALARWLIRCHALTGSAPREGNLRNFLWDGVEGRIYGLDLEDHAICPLKLCGAAVAAAVLDHAPEETPLKREAAGILADRMGAAEEDVASALANLRDRRKARRTAELSGVVLAGGTSQRMGADKASLRLGGATLLERQTEKLRALGIRDILLSGTGLPSLPGTRSVRDELPGRGPLGGLHACLKQAKNPACMVLSVDVPLVPENALAQMRCVHRDGVTVLCCKGREEPLIGIYDSTLSDKIEMLLAQGDRSVRSLKEAVSWDHYDYLGPEELLRNCNDPEDMRAARSLWAAYEAVPN